MNKGIINYLNIRYIIITVLFLLLISLVEGYWEKLIILTIFTYISLYVFSIRRISKNYLYFNIFELRFISISLVFIYSIIPLIGFLFSGFELNEYSDNRIRSLKLNSEILFLFYLKFYLPFFISFIAAILIFSKDNIIKLSNKLPININLFIVIVLSLIIFNIFFIYYVNDGSSPLIFKQLNNLFGHYRLVCNFFFIIFIFLNWNNIFARYLFILCLLFLFYEVMSGLSSRTFFFKHILAILLLYSLLIKQLKINHVFYIGIISVLLAIFIGANNTNMGDISFSLKKMGVASNEWWSVFGTAFELYNFKLNEFFNYTSNTLTKDIPNYILFNDFYYLIPQQFVTKVDPSLWYLDYIKALDGKPKFGIGFTWGSVANLAIWNNLFYTVLYGLSSGYIIRIFHNWYIKRNKSIYAIVVYLCMCIYCYSIMRVSMGYFIYEIFYRVLPFIIILFITTNILSTLSYYKQDDKL